MVKHGGNGGTLSVTRLGVGEKILSMYGNYGDHVDLLVIRTNLRTLTWGGPGGPGSFNYEAMKGTWILGFLGRAGEFLDAIGVLIYDPRP